MRLQSNDWPKITVLLPAYQAAAFLAESLESLCRQTYPHFEVLVLDDGSTDATAEIAGSFCARDTRFQLQRLPHRGLVATLNEGLRQLRTPFVARLDADDVCAPARFEKQLAFLEKNRAVGVVGTWLAVGNWAGPLFLTPATDPDRIAALLFFDCPVMHPTVMARSEALRGQTYDPAFTHAEDYDLWERISSSVRFANISEPLVLYGSHSAQVSHVYSEAQGAASRSVRRRQLVRLLGDCAPALSDVHEALVARVIPLQGAPEATRLAAALIEANRMHRRYPSPAFEKVMAIRWARCAAQDPRWLFALREARRSPIAPDLRSRTSLTLRVLAYRFLGWKAQETIHRAMRSLRTMRRR